MKTARVASGFANTGQSKDTHMNSIDQRGREASPPAGVEWCVRVSVSVLNVVPRDVLNAWMACESYQRSNDSFWPDNQNLCVAMGVRASSSARRLLGRLERLGILERHLAEGNRRTLRLRRRTSDPITPGEWAEMELMAEAAEVTETAPI